MSDKNEWDGKEEEEGGRNLVLGSREYSHQDNKDFVNLEGSFGRISKEVGMISMFGLLEGSPTLNLQFIEVNYLLHFLPRFKASEGEFLQHLLLLSESADVSVS